MGKSRTRRPEGGDNLYKLPQTYIAVDTETTGLDFDLCDIIEFGAIKVVDGEKTESFNSLIGIGYQLDPFITELTGITDEMLQSTPRFLRLSKALKRLLATGFYLPITPHST